MSLHPPPRWAGCRSRLGRAVAIATAAGVLEMPKLPVCGDGYFIVCIWVGVCLCVLFLARR